MRSAAAPLLIAAAGAAPQLERGTVGGAHVRDVDALVRLGVDQIAGGGERELLCPGAVAGPQLHGGAVGGRAAGDVHALAERRDRAVRVERPALRAGAVAVPQLQP